MPPTPRGRQRACADATAQRTALLARWTKLARTKTCARRKPARATGSTVALPAISLERFSERGFRRQKARKSARKCRKSARKRLKVSQKCRKRACFCLVLSRFGVLTCQNGSRGGPAKARGETEMLTWPTACVMNVSTGAWTSPWLNWIERWPRSQRLKVRVLLGTLFITSDLAVGYDSLPGVFLAPQAGAQYSCGSPCNWLQLNTGPSLHTYWFPTLQRPHFPMPHFILFSSVV